MTSIEMVSLLKKGKIEASVEGDEDCFVTPRGEVEVGDDGQCRLIVSACVPTDPDLGCFGFSVGGVDVSVSRGTDGPLDDWDFNGEEIDCSAGPSEDDIISVIKESVKFPPMENFTASYNDMSFDSDDVEESTETDYDIFALDDEGTVYAFESADEVPEGLTTLGKDKAIHRLVEEWEENGSDVEI